MRALVQLMLVRLAASVWSLALRIGQQPEEDEGARSGFEAEARRVIASSPGRGAGEPPIEAPDGYAFMTPRAHIDASIASSVLLVDQSESQFVPIFVGPTEGLAFAHRLEGRRFSRPLTHDLFDALLAEVGANITSVRIDRIDADVFIATIVIAMPGDRVIELDARASDAIVLALGCGAPIVVADDVVRQAGRPLAAGEA